MSQQFRLTGPQQRWNAMKAVEDAPDGYVVKIAAETRRDAQNRKMWACLADISKAMPMGRRHTAEDWKVIFMNACGWECQFLEGLDGRPFPHGFKSSQLTVDQMRNLIEYITAFGAEHQIAWSEDYENRA